MTSKLNFAWFVASLALSIQASAQTFSDYDSKIDFKKYQTYAWIAPGDSVLNRIRSDKVYAGFIMHTANQELTRRGMIIDTLRPDVLFVFHTQIREEVKYSQSPTLSVGVGVAGPGYYVGGSAPVAGGDITATTYNKGTLVYEMYDTRTGKLVWRGGTSKSFDLEDDIQKLIAEATKKVFKKLPKKELKKK